MPAKRQYWSCSDNDCQDRSRLQKTRKKKDGESFSYTKKKNMKTKT